MKLGLGTAPGPLGCNSCILCAGLWRWLIVNSCILQAGLISRAFVLFHEKTAFDRFLFALEISNKSNDALRPAFCGEEIQNRPGFHDFRSTLLPEADTGRNELQLGHTVSEQQPATVHLLCSRSFNVNKNVNLLIFEKLHFTTWDDKTW